MEEQKKLFSQSFKEVEEEPQPEIKVIRNTFMTAGALVREEIIKKVWIIPKKSN